MSLGARRVWLTLLSSTSHPFTTLPSLGADCHVFLERPARLCRRAPVTSELMDRPS